MKRTYGQKRAEAIRELAMLRKHLLSRYCTVDQINRAYKLQSQLKQLYNL